MTKSSKEAGASDLAQTVECRICPPNCIKVFLTLGILLLAILVWMHRYEYRLVNFGVKGAEVQSAVRFDRWTQKVQIYVTLGKAEKWEDIENLKTGWTDFAKRMLVLTAVPSQEIHTSQVID